tara:strand:- start:28936 stop:30237 length:1302 start_codon:yes stop_codon:yes gene_type:complete
MRHLIQQMFESLKWQFFVLLNKLADARGGVTAELAIHYPAEFKPGGHYFWVFCSTIGEVNACHPFLVEVAKRGQLVLLTDRHCYRDSYWRHFPAAMIVELSGRIDDGQRLAQQLPPERFIVCEIPAQPVEAPCRLSYGIVRAAKKSGALCHLVNVWLYHYQPSCRIDAVEQRLFGRDFLRSFDFVSVQTESVKHDLIEKGLDSNRVAVSGNIKFDALEDTSTLLLDQRSRGCIEQLEQADRVVVVAGCLTDVWEFQLVLDAFVEAQQSSPQLYLVLAPRHPEYAEPMAALWQALDNSGLSYCVKSLLADGDEITQHSVMVLDTFGELKSFYSRCDLSYVGVNHNVLEPLSFSRQVTVSPGWEATYPSFPVYQVATELALIKEVATAAELAQAMLQAEANEQSQSASVSDKLAELTGATDKTIEYVFAQDGQIA